MMCLKMVSGPLFGGLGLVLGLTAPAAAHEFWIEPKAYRVAPGAEIVADLKVGQNFKGDAYPYLKNRFVSFTVADQAGARAVTGDEGDVPAATIRTQDTGLKVLSYLATAHRLDFDTWEDFVSYVEQEGLGWVTEAHKRRGLPDRGFAEEYVRCAKALVQVGPPSPAHQDRAVGMPLELIADQNPYADPNLVELPVILLWQGKPIGDIQLTIFQVTGGGGAATRTTLRTNAAGKATVSLRGGGTFLLNAVHMQATPPDRDAKWESHWASLTFEIRR
jgi:uncharacterized GH25 family protein